MVLGNDWVAETALPGPVRNGARVSYAPATIARLVDSPLDAGNVFRRFMLLDSGGFTNEIDAFADRTEQLDMSSTSLAGFKAMVAEMDAIYGARHWQHYHFLLTVSDVFPGNGVEHGSSSDDGNEGNALTEPEGVVGTAGLLSHEFNHSWDGKYRRPAGMAVNNFQVPERTELLWVYEDDGSTAISSPFARVCGSRTTTATRLPSSSTRSKITSREGSTGRSPTRRPPRRSCTGRRGR